MTNPPEPEPFEDLYRTAPFGDVSVDRDGLVTRINDTLLGWTGYQRDAVVGRAFTDLLDPASRLFYETRLQPTLQLQGSLNEVAVTLQGIDGAAIPAIAHSMVVPGGTRIALGPAAERREYERALLLARRAAEESESRVRVLQAASAAFGACTTVAELVDALADSARSAFDARVLVALPDDDGELRPVSGDQIPTFERPVQATGPAARAWVTAAPVVVTDPAQIAAEFPDLVEMFREARTEAVTAVPILDDTTPIGVLVCLFGRPRAVDPDALELQGALARIAAQMLARMRLQDALALLATRDQLTGLGNRILLQDRASRALERAHAEGSPLAIMFFDLDGFKAVNDRLGHGAGDEVLRRVAERVVSVVRAGDFVGRFGGDEFVVVCEDADAVQASAIAERIRAIIAEPLDGVDVPITASVGVVLLDAQAAAAVSTEQLWGRADAAMYASKDSGRNRVTVDAVNIGADAQEGESWER